MLKENPRSRPNIYQVLREACLMQGIEIPIKDVCWIPRQLEPRLTIIDICCEDTIRNQTEPTIAITNKGNGLASHCRRGFLTSNTT